jgi:hypothetical protein
VNTDGKHREAAAAKIAALLPALREAGLDEITILYSGENGKSDIETPDDIPEELRGDLIDCIYDLLPDGWTDDDGSAGDAIIDVDQGTLAIHHWQRFVAWGAERRYSYGLFSAKDAP